MTCEYISLVNLQYENNTYKIKGVRKTPNTTKESENMSANTTATVQQAARFAAAGFGTASDITEALASTLGWTNDEAAAAIAAAL